MKSPRTIQGEDSVTSLQKIIITFLLIIFVIGGSNFITSSFPQNILISQDTIIELNDNILAFQDIGINGANITINAEQHQANNYDTIAMGGRESVILTGKQTVVGEQTLFNGLLSIPTKINHIALFEQSSLSIPDNSKRIKIEFRDEVLEIEYKCDNIYEVKSGQSLYDIVITDNKFTYITDSNNEALFKVWHKDNEIVVILVGYYGKEEFTITVLEEKIVET